MTAVSDWLKVSPVQGDGIIRGQVFTGIAAGVKTAPWRGRGPRAAGAGRGLAGPWAWRGPSLLPGAATLPLANAPCAAQFARVLGALQPCLLRISARGSPCLTTRTIVKGLNHRVLAKRAPMSWPAGGRSNSITFRRRLFGQDRCVSEMPAVNLEGAVPS